MTATGSPSHYGCNGLAGLGMFLHKPLDLSIPRSPFPSVPNPKSETMADTIVGKGSGLPRGGPDFEADRCSSQGKIPGPLTKPPDSGRV